MSTSLCSSTCHSMLPFVAHSGGHLLSNTLDFCLAPHSQRALKHVSLLFFLFFFLAWHRYRPHWWQRRRKSIGSCVWENYQGRGWLDPAFMHRTEKQRKRQQIGRTIFNQICSLYGKTQANDILLTLPGELQCFLQQGPGIKMSMSPWLLQNSHYVGRSLCPFTSAGQKSKTRKLVVNETMLVLFVDQRK